MTLFSGDAFNPSLESSVTKGKHMVPALNELQTSVACLGNHDLDFGVEQFQYLASRCNFPWLCANVLDPALGDEIPLGNCKRTVMLTSSNGIKVGFIGIVEREWLDTINTLPPNLKYLSASATAADLAPKLRAEGAEIIIILSHQREPNDNKLAEKLPPGTVDMVLGGHDHFYGHSVINGTHVLRSGTDFKQLSYIEARRRKDDTTGWDFNIIRRDVVSSLAQEPEAAKMVEKLTSALKAKLDKPVGYTAAPLDARFTTVRLKESNLGNFVCDLMRFHYHADCTIMASGTIRGDQIYPPGVLRMKDIMNCFPFEDPCVVIALKGKYIAQALENAVGK
jgi:2',3'-cyclic-nucleotide 2'-phosphodiesterase (5'-nucleotidase family)